MPSLPCRLSALVSDAVNASVWALGTKFWRLEISEIALSPGASMTAIS